LNRAVVRSGYSRAKWAVLRSATSQRVNNIAATLQVPVIENIFTHLCLQARAPPRARGWMTGRFAALN